MTSALALMLTLLALGFQEAAAGAATPRTDWQVVSLPDGSELRYLPPRVTDEDYPVGARRVDAQGTSVLRLKVDTSGQILSCATARSSGSLELDERACLLYRNRARFELRGTTEPIILHAPVTWRLESGPRPADEMPQDRR